jgi:hypothetical protein
MELVSVSNPVTPGAGISTGVPSRPGSDAADERGEIAYVADTRRCHRRGCSTVER